MLIEGPAGIGKTRLIQEARRRAGEGGMRVLTARGSEIERDFAFGVVRQLVEGLLVDPAVAERAFAGAAQGARPISAAWTRRARRATRRSRRSTASSGWW